MSPSAAIVDYLLNTADPLPERTRSASALPWNPPTWQLGMWDAQTSELNTKDTQSKTLAQAAFSHSCTADTSVSSENEEVSGGSAGGNTNTESSSRGEPDSLGVDLETPKPQHEMSHPQMGTTTEAYDIQGHDKASLKATENVTPVCTTDPKGVPYQGPTIIDGSIEEHYVPPQTINTPDDVDRGRTVTRQAGPEVYIGPLPIPQVDQDVQYDQTPTRQAGPGVYIGPIPMGQADQDIQYDQTPTRQAVPDVYYSPIPTRQAALYLNPGPIPMTQAGQDVQYNQTPARPEIYGETLYPTTRFDGLILGTSMMSGECHFCASIVSKPVEQEAIFQDLYRNNQQLDLAAIINKGPFWEIQAFHCYYCIEAQRLPITTAQHNLCVRGIFTHQGMMNIIRRQHTLPHPDCCKFHSPSGPTLRYIRF